MAEVTKTVEELATETAEAERVALEKSKNEEVVKTPSELESDMRAKLEAETDKRITDAIKKREKVLKDEFAEKIRKEKLTEEQAKKEEQESITKNQAIKDRELNTRSLKLDLVDVLSENGMDLKFRDLININDLLAVSPEERAGAMTKKVTGFKKIVDDIVAKQVAEIKKEYTKGTTPTKLSGMNPTLTGYDKAKAEGNVHNMISEKFKNKK